MFEKIEMYEEIYILFVNIELNKKIYDVVEIQEDVIDCLIVGFKDEEIRFDYFCVDRCIIL